MGVYSGGGAKGAFPFTCDLLDQFASYADAANFYCGTKCQTAHTHTHTHTVTQPRHGGVFRGGEQRGRSPFGFVIIFS